MTGCLLTSVLRCKDGARSDTSPRGATPKGALSRWCAEEPRRDFLRKGAGRLGAFANTLPNGRSDENCCSKPQLWLEDIDRTSWQLGKPGLESLCELGPMPKSDGRASPKAKLCVEDVSRWREKPGLVNLGTLDHLMPQKKSDGRASPKAKLWFDDMGRAPWHSKPEAPSHPLCRSEGLSSTTVLRRGLASPAEAKLHRSCSMVPRARRFADEDDGALWGLRDLAAARRCHKERVQAIKRSKQFTRRVIEKLGVLRELL